MKYKLIILLTTTLLTSCFSNEEKAQDKSAPNWLAKVENQIITKADIQQELTKRPFLRNASEEIKQQAREDSLKQRIEFETLVHHAKQQGLDQHPDVLEAMKKVMVQKYKQNFLNKELNEPVKVQDYEVQQEYQARKNVYQKPDRVRLAMIYLKRKRNQKLESGRKQAKSVYQQVKKKNADFGELAKKYSDDRKSKYKQGLTGWLEKGKPNKIWPTEVNEQIVKLSPKNKYSSLIETSAGWYIFKFIQEQKSKPVTYPEVRNRLKQVVIEKKKRERWEKLMKDLQSDLDIEVKKQELKTVKVNEKGGNAPPRMPF